MGSGISHLYEGTYGSKPNLLIPSVSIKTNKTTNYANGSGGAGGVGGGFSSEDFSIGLKNRDLIVLIREFRGMPIGTMGLIISKADKTHYKIRFFYKDGDTIGVYLTPRSAFKLLN